MRNEKWAGAMKRAVRKVRKKSGMLAAAFLISHSSFFIFMSCARMGSPDGGWYDDTPPQVVSAMPAERAVNVQSKKIIINFSEFIKIENAQEKVIVSPPQIEQADIKTQGKRIVIELKDSLKPNTTYTVDFSDAITDNNEGNPMGQYTYSFSTGDRIDTLEVSGYVLNAEDLEPVKGMLVGLYPYDAPDSCFRTEPMMRVSRTNGSGRFTVKGIAPGSYRAYALNDADGDFRFGQKSELIAYNRDSIVPSWKPDTRPDTIWRDSLHILNIVRVPYTHFLPDDITLLSFQEPQTDRFLLKTERQTPEKLGIYFTYGHDSLPRLRGLNFPSDSAFVVEHSLRRDTVYYWLRDTTLINQDSLNIEVTYMSTDTLGQLYERSDTLSFEPKVPYEKRLKDRLKEQEKWEKEQAKKKKNGLKYDSIMPRQWMELKFVPDGTLTPLQNISIEAPVPIGRCDTAAVHLYMKVDSLWYSAPHTLTQLSPRRFTFSAQWQPDTEYSLEVDSAAFTTIYGLENKAIKKGLKVSGPDDFSTLDVTVSGAPITAADSMAVVVVQLLDGSGKVVRHANATGGRVHFDYVKPATYYLSAYCDMNGNGQWDTGLYDEDRQPEPVYYFHEEVECKQKWDVKRQWNLTAKPRYEQKPQKLVKQKPEQARKQKNRNIERARQLGIEYLQDKTGVRM